MRIRNKVCDHRVDLRDALSPGGSCLRRQRTRTQAVGAEHLQVHRAFGQGQPGEQGGSGRRGLRGRLPDRQHGVRQAERCHHRLRQAVLLAGLRSENYGYVWVWDSFRETAGDYDVTAAVYSYSQDEVLGSRSWLNTTGQEFWSTARPPSRTARRPSAPCARRATRHPTTAPPRSVAETARLTRGWTEAPRTDIVVRGASRTSRRPRGSRCERWRQTAEAIRRTPSSRISGEVASVEPSRAPRRPCRRPARGRGRPGPAPGRRAAGSLAQAQRAAVQPGEERALVRPVAHLAAGAAPSSLASSRRFSSSPASSASSQSVPCRSAGDVTDHAEVARAVARPPPACRASSSADSPSGDRQGRLQPGQVPRLRRRHQGEGPLRAGHRQIRHVAGAGQHERRVDLVGDDPYAVLVRQLRHGCQLRCGVDGAGRVVRAAQQIRGPSAGRRCPSRPAAVGRPRRGCPCRAGPRRSAAPPRPCGPCATRTGRRADRQGS